MSVTFNEDSFEKALIELFQNNLGYDYKCGYDIERDYSEVVLWDTLCCSLAKINPDSSKLAIEEAIRKIKMLPSNNLILDNETFTNYLQNGVEVSFSENGKIKSDIIKLIDYSENGMNNNDFLLVNQFTIKQNDIVKRPDLIIFANGLPLVVVELKSCSREETDSLKKLK